MVTTVHHLSTVHELRCVLDEPTSDVVPLRALLIEYGRSQSCRT